MEKISAVLNAPADQWLDWRWQMRQKPVCSDARNLASLGLVDVQAENQPQRIGLTPYNVSLLLDLCERDQEGFKAEMLESFLPPNDEQEVHQWVWARRHDLPGVLHWSIPRFLKTFFTGCGSDTTVRALENMYPKTDVLIATAACARNCSFCFREVGDPQGEAARMTGGMDTVLQAVHAIVARRTPHVLVTGGDPLTRSNEQLRQILSPLAQSPTVQVLRLATRMAVDLPMRFYDQELLAILRALALEMKQRGASFRIVTHINHPCQLTLEARKALENIQACGIDVLNQTVVLRGVNDNAATLRKLLMLTDRLGVRPFKLYHTMPAPGTEHLRVPLRRFRELLSELHQWLPSTAVPQANMVTLVGKMPVAPSGRWLLSIPFTNRILCRSYRHEWYLFRDAWDIRRLGRELIAGLALVALFIIALPLPKQPSQVVDSPRLITRVAVLAEEIGYPDAWARQRFVPYVVDNTLFIPVHGL